MRRHYGSLCTEVDFPYYRARLAAVAVPKSRIDLGGVRKGVGTFVTAEDDEITLDRHATWDPVKRLESTMRFYEKIRAGAVVAREEPDFPLRWWDEDELTALLDEAVPPGAAHRWWCLTARSR